MPYCSTFRKVSAFTSMTTHAQTNLNRYWLNRGALLKRLTAQQFVWTTERSGTPQTSSLHVKKRFHRRCCFRPKPQSRCNHNQPRLLPSSSPCCAGLSANPNRVRGTPTTLFTYTQIDYLFHLSSLFNFHNYMLSLLTFACILTR